MRAKLATCNAHAAALKTYTQNMLQYLHVCTKQPSWFTTESHARVICKHSTHTIFPLLHGVSKLKRRHKKPLHLLYHELFVTDLQPAILTRSSCVQQHRAAQHCLHCMNTHTCTTCYWLNRRVLILRNIWGDKRTPWKIERKIWSFHARGTHSPSHHTWTLSRPRSQLNKRAFGVHDRTVAAICRR